MQRLVAQKFHDTHGNDGFRMEALKGLPCTSPGEG
jgi:hypothetical protein